MTAPSTAIIGSTGLIGSNILSILLAHEIFNPVNTITRRAPSATSPLLNALIETDTDKWAGALKSLTPIPSTVISALGTTRAAAGSIANQWKIDHDLNIDLAKAAKEAGAKTYIFISSGSTRGFIGGMSPYGKMKNGVEDAIKALEFDQAIILKPGVILGQREQSRAGESQLQSIIRSIGSFSGGIKDRLGQEADVIARATLRAAQLADQGKAPSKYWVVEADEIIKLGRPEWTDKEPATAAPEETKTVTQ